MDFKRQNLTSKLFKGLTDLIKLFMKKKIKRK